ncbi:DUF6170 family protein [Aliiglaciecola sp. 2_MG-2023]|uniref:DUF6170 family protein n=1 Tax=Alteromonadaceae TaxID=72275 RepID=UPI001C09A23C|nr:MULTISPECIES: DUF6170 family protein [Aliiglaciecola]MBU2877745.1 hypothetical protein [Aliiglaciecola lipolytica]MDO6709095.1 DUF6170 family protein [Aliiglaciecola sp. 2_MG-2023]MDO6750243.1 DUF6170 family protein [Aliiglaciecola sp. 1_MG-2023]
MKFYFSTRQIPQLQNLSLKERFVEIRAAESKLTAPEKLFLNVIKLLIMVPFFVFVLRTFQDWSSLLWAALIIIAYPLILKPFQYSLSAKYLKQPDDSQIKE